MEFRSIDTCFSGQTDAIADLRATVAVFDEVCRDYEALQAELGALLERRESRDTIWIANVEETLAALTEEIASALEAYADPPGLPDRWTTHTKYMSKKNGDRHDIKTSGTTPDPSDARGGARRCFDRLRRHRHRAGGRDRP